MPRVKRAEAALEHFSELEDRSRDDRVAVERESVEHSPGEPPSHRRLLGQEVAHPGGQGVLERSRRDLRGLRRGVVRA